MISVIIPARDAAGVIAGCLDSLARQILPPAEVLVVDDASSDDTARLVEERWSWARVLRLGEQRGFAGACTAGLAEARGSWIAVLNADTVAEPQWLAEALAAAESDPAIGSAASTVFLAGREKVIDSLGLRVSLTGFAYLRAHGQPATPSSLPSEPHEVFGASGAAAFYRRSALEEVGFYEKDFFIYYEDVDLAYRLRWAGYKCIFVPGAWVHHQHSHHFDVPAKAGRKRFYLQRNRLRTLVRNWPLAWLAEYLPLLAAGEAAAFARGVKEAGLKLTAQARCEVFRFWEHDRQVREETLSRARLSAAEMKTWLHQK